MQGSAQSPIPAWLVNILTHLATLIPFGALWYRERQNRKKLESDVSLQSSQTHLSDAQVRLTDAQTESTQLTTQLTMAERLERCYLKIDDLETNADSLVRERNALKVEADKVPHLQDTIKLYEKQLSDQECIISAAEIDKGAAMDKLRGIKPESG